MTWGLLSISCPQDKDTELNKIAGCDKRKDTLHFYMRDSLWVMTPSIAEGTCKYIKNICDQSMGCIGPCVARTTHTVGAVELWVSCFLPGICTDLRDPLL